MHVENMVRAKIGPNRRILPKVPNFLGNPIYIDGAIVVLTYAWQQFYLFDPSQYLFSYLSYGRLSVGERFFWKTFTWPRFGTLSVAKSPCALEPFRRGLENDPGFGYKGTPQQKPSLGKDKLILLGLAKTTRNFLDSYLLIWSTPSFMHHLYRWW